MSGGEEILTGLVSSITELLDIKDQPEKSPVSSILGGFGGSKLVGGLLKAALAEDEPAYGGAGLVIGTIGIIVVLAIIVIAYIYITRSPPQAQAVVVDTQPPAAIYTPDSDIVGSSAVASGPSVSSKTIYVGQKGSSTGTAYAFSTRAGDASSNGYSPTDMIVGLDSQENGTVPWCVGSAYNGNAKKYNIAQSSNCGGYGWTHNDVVYLPASATFAGKATKPFSTYHTSSWAYKVARPDQFPAAGDSQWIPYQSGYSIE